MKQPLFTPNHNPESQASKDAREVATQPDKAAIFAQIKIELGVTNNDIAAWFGYKSGKDFRKSTRYEKVRDGIIELYQRIKVVE